MHQSRMAPAAGGSSEILALLGGATRPRPAPALDPSDFPSLGRSSSAASSAPPPMPPMPPLTAAVTSAETMYGFSRGEDSRFALHKADFPSLPGPGAPMNRGGGDSRGIVSSQSLPPNMSRESAVTGNYGLMGLMGLIKNEDPDRGILAGGMDLTTLGLNLNSNESLQTTFSSPWTEDPSQSEFIFSLPASFPSQVVVRPEIMEKVSLETLFVCFYSMPREILQCLAAQELVNRSWRLHEEHRLWFSQGKNGSVIFFDVMSFERRVFPGRLPDEFEAGFVPTEVINSVYRSALAQLSAQAKNTASA